jgi:hypothetical protein
MSTPWRTPKVIRPREEVQKLFVDLLYLEMPDVNWTICGSWRRRASNIGDLDIMVVTESGTLTDKELPASFIAQHVGPRIVQGDLIYALDESSVLDAGASPTIHADFYACTPAEAAFCAMFLTGPKALNIQQRAQAQKLGMKLSQYGLFAPDGTVIKAETEEEVYRRLGMAWISPEDRQNYVEAKAPEEAPVRWVTARSDSDRTKRYAIRIKGRLGEPGTELKCRCPAYQYSREIPASCKHCKRLLAAGEEGIKNGRIKIYDQEPEV